MIIGAIVIFMGGFAYGSLAHYVDYMNDCPSYTKKGIVWEGYRAISDKNDRRCFFIEQKYPYRTWHGKDKNQ